MTKQHFVPWLEAHDCELSPFQAINSTSPKLIIKNKKNGRDAFLQLPIDERPMKDATICMICLLLLMPVPDGIVCVARSFN